MENKIVLSVGECLARLKEIGDAFAIRNQDDMDIWISGGSALNDLKAAHRQEQKRKITRKDIAGYCEPYGISIATAYRWIVIGVYEAQIRRRLTERGMTSADQNTLLEWAKEWKPTAKNPGVKAKRKYQPPCPTCSRLMNKKLAKQVAERSADKRCVAPVLPALVLPATPLVGPLGLDLTVRMELRPLVLITDIMELNEKAELNYDIVVAVSVVNKVTCQVVAEGGMEKLLEVGLFGTA